MKELIISHPTQLNSISTIPLKGIKNVGRIRLSGNMAAHPEREKFEQKLNNQFRACGCDVGAKGMVIGLVASSIYGLYQYISKDYSLSQLGLTLLGGVVGMSLIGKLYGLYQADRRLQSTIQEIKAVWQPEKAFREENMICG